MDDILMADDLSSSTSFQHRFGIVDVLGESSRSTASLISSAIAASAVAVPETVLSTNSVMFEKDESVAILRLQKLYPFIDLKKDLLPRYWNETASSLSRTPDFLRVHYIDKGGRDPKQAAAARANRSVPNMTIVYYFEIFVANKGENGFMGVGLTTKNVEINRLPGWDQTSYGYHGDDGHFFESAGKGVSYGPTYTTGDTVGCGLNFMTRELFFTKNGEFLGIATNNVKVEENLFPTAGMQTNGEMIDVNFGQKPFKFDIESYRKQDESIVAKSIQSIDLPPEKAIWMNRAISAWLEHEGYSRALNALNNATNGDNNNGVAIEPVNIDLIPTSTPLEGNSDFQFSEQNTDIVTRRSVVKHVQEATNEEMENRRKIMRLVQEGKTAEAVKEVDLLFPTLLSNNNELVLLLKIQQYIEMVAEIAKENSLHKREVVSKNENGNSAFNNSMDFNASGTPSELWSDALFSDSICNLPSFNSSSNGCLSMPGGRVKRLVPPFYMENGRNSLKRRSSEDDSECRQLPRRIQHQKYFNSVSVPGSSSSYNDSQSDVVDEAMDTHLDVSKNGKLSSLNGLSQVFVASGTPPTSTTIIEELEDLNDSWNVSADDNVESRIFNQDCCSSNDLQHLQCFLPVIEFGHSISQFSQQISAFIASPSLFKRMNDAFSLIGYSDPMECNNNYILEHRQRNIVAKALNRAILDMLGKEKSSRLDTYIRKTRLDRQRSLAFSTAAVYSDVDKLLFCSSYLSESSKSGLVKSNLTFKDENNENKTKETIETKVNFCGVDDDHSNSSAGSSSIGAGCSNIESGESGLFSALSNQNKPSSSSTL